MGFRSGRVWGCVGVGRYVYTSFSLGCICMLEMVVG